MKTSFSALFFLPRVCGVMGRAPAHEAAFLTLPPETDEKTECADDSAKASLCVLTSMVCSHLLSRLMSVRCSPMTASLTSHPIRPPIPSPSQIPPHQPVLFFDNKHGKYPSIPLIPTIRLVSHIEEGQEVPQQAWSLASHPRAVREGTASSGCSHKDSSDDVALDPAIRSAGQQ